MWTAKFWRDAAERAVKSTAQAVVLYVGADVTFDAWHAGWATAGGIALAATALSLLSSLASSKVGDSTSASLVGPAR
jgi:hypothetical protein